MSSGIDNMAENVNPDGVLILINEELKSLRSLSGDCCIYRVPENLRKVNENAYHPWAVSIGPVHHGDPKLEPMQEHKLRYWQSLLKHNPENDSNRYVQLVRDKQAAIRDCYNQQIELGYDDFVKMVILDAAFIIELFIRMTSNILSDKVDATDHICSKDVFSTLIFRDLKLIENQLPFFILDDFYNLTLPHLVHFYHIPFSKLACLYFGQEDSVCDMIAKVKIKHFVDLLRQSYLWSILGKKSDARDDNSNNKKTSGNTFSPSVTQLHEAG